MKPNHESYEFDRKTRFTITGGLGWAILILVIGATATGTKAWCDMNAKQDRMLDILQNQVMYRAQAQEWIDQFRQDNTPWRSHIVVPPLPRPNEPVGKRNQNVAEVP